jgi:hypothetical protein
MEYSILSDILGNPTSDSGASPPALQTQYSTGWPSDSLSQAQYGQSPSMGSNGYETTYGEPQQLSIQPSDTMSGSPVNQMSPPYTDSYSMSHYQQRSPPNQSGNQQQVEYTRQYGQQQQQNHQPPALHPLEPRFPREFHASPSPTSATAAFVRSHSRDSIMATLASPGATHSPPTSVRAAYADGTEGLRGSHGQRMAYVTRPFDYTEGYHFLMKHLHSRCVSRHALLIKNKWP